MSGQIEDLSTKEIVDLFANRLRELINRKNLLITSNQYFEDIKDEYFDIQDQLSLIFSLIDHYSKPVRPIIIENRIRVPDCFRQSGIGLSDQLSEQLYLSSLRNH